MRSAMASMIRSQLASTRQVLVVVGGVDVFERSLAGERRRLQFLEAIDGLAHDAVLVAFLGRKVEQHDRHVGIGKVRGDLRAHHAGAEDGGFFYDQLVQAVLLQMLLFRSSHARPRKTNV